MPPVKNLKSFYTEQFGPVLGTRDILVRIQFRTSG